MASATIARSRRFRAINVSPACAIAPPLGVRFGVTTPVVVTSIGPGGVWSMP